MTAQSVANFRYYKFMDKVEEIPTVYGVGLFRGR
jgi:hypothetical protein